MYLIDHFTSDHTEVVPGRWAVAKPDVNMNMARRLYGAYLVLTGRAIPVQFAEDYIRRNKC